MTIETKRRAMQTIEIIRQSRPSLRAVFRDVAKKLEREGWWVCRSAGSNGAADLVAIKGLEYLGRRVTAILLVQCKSGKERISGREKQELIDLSNKLNVTAAVGFKNKAGRVVVQVVTGKR